ncbi:MAG TPA: DsrE family protein [Bryobacteraceae bacterium]|nr:DsrE family protein [Bryobacteraceae bacterium]
MQLARQMQSMGAEGTMLLDLEGVRLANTRETQNLIWGKGEPISGEYETFVKAGGQVLLCEHCAAHAGITAATLRPGARIAKEGELARTILAAEKVIDY